MIKINFDDYTTIKIINYMRVILYYLPDLTDFKLL